MGLEEVLVGQLGDDLGVAAGVEAVAVVREKAFHHVFGLEFFHGGQGALHFVVDHAVVDGVLGCSGRGVGVCGMFGDGGHGHGAFCQRGCGCGGRGGLLTQLVVPAFLAENALVGIDCGPEHCVQVHLGQVQEVLLIFGRHRVHGLVREGHGVEECGHGALEEVQEGLLHREVLGPLQHRVLQYVKNAG